MLKVGNLGPVFDKLVALCRRNLYEATPSTDNLTLNTGGPCGVLLRNNIHDEWLASTLFSPHHPIFGLHASVSQGANVLRSRHDGLQLNQMPTYSRSCLQNYPAMLQYLRGRIPFGLAQCGVVSIGAEAVDDDMSDLARFGPSQTVMATQFYVPPRILNAWHQEWKLHRLLWWQKFSEKPSDFGFSIAKNDPVSLDIQYNFPWGWGTVERVNSFSSDMVQQMLSEEPEANCLVNDKGKLVYPSIIECVTSVEAAALTYLTDAMRESTLPDGSTKFVLSLHDRLTPYKVSLISSWTDSQFKELNNYLIKDLRKRGLMTFCLPDDASHEQQFTRYDEMGITYCAILSEDTLKNGTVLLRHRDTAVHEQIHVSVLAQTLQKYSAGSRIRSTTFEAG